MLLALRCYQLVSEELYVRCDTLHANFPQFSHSFHLPVDTPNFYHAVCSP